MGFLDDLKSAKLSYDLEKARKNMNRANDEFLAGRRSLDSSLKASQAYYGAKLDLERHEEKKNSVLHKIVGWPF